MTAPPAPPPPVVRQAPLSVGGIIREARDLLMGHPRQAIVPFLVVEVPVAAVLAVVTSLLLFTAFRDETFITLADLDSKSPRGVFFMWVAAYAASGLFSQVARAAAIVSVAGVATGRTKTLTECLDVAFTRMGALLLQALLLFGALVAMAVSLFLLPLVPYFLARWGVAPEAMVLEQLGPMQGIRRSWQLTTRRVLRFLGALLLSVAFVLIPFFVVSLLGEAVVGSRTQQILLFGVVTVLQAALLAPAIAFLTAVTTLFYLKARAIDGQ